MLSHAIIAAALSLLAAAPQEPAPSLRSAQRLLQAKDLRGAARELIQVVENSPQASTRQRAADMLAVVTAQLLRSRDLASGIDAARTLVAAARRAGRDDALARALNSQGYCLTGLGQPRAALPVYEEALRLARERYLGQHPELAKAAMNVASCHFALGAREAAEALLAEFPPSDRDHDIALANIYLDAGQPRRALPLIEAADAAFGPLGPGSDGYLEARIGHAQCLMDLARFPEAGGLLEQTRDAIERKLGTDAQDIAAIDSVFAVCLQRAGESERAIVVAERVLARLRAAAMTENTEWITAASARLAALIDLGRCQTAVNAAEDFLADTRRVYRDEHPDVARAIGTLGTCLVLNGQVRAGIAKYRESLAMRTALFGHEHLEVAQAIDSLASGHVVAGEAPEALRQFDAALAIRHRVFEGDHPDVARGHNNLGGCLVALGRFDDALRAYERALAMYRRLFPGDHPDVALALGNVASVQFDLHLPACETNRTASLAMLRRLFTGDHPQIVRTLANYGAECLARDQTEKARACFDEAASMFERLGVVDHPDRLRLAYNMAHCAELRGDLDAASAGYRDVVDACERIHGAESWDLVGVLTALARCRQRQDADPGEVEGLLTTALAATERLRERAHVVDAETRTLYFHRLKRVGPFADLMEFERRRGNGARVLDLIEQMRGREMLDLLHDAEFDPLAMASENEGEPARRAAIEQLAQDLARGVEEVTRVQRQFFGLSAEDRQPDAPACRALLEQLEAAESALRRQRTEEAQLIAAVTPSASPATHAEVQAQLQDGELLLCYVLGETRSMVLVVAKTPAPIAIADVPLGRAAVAALVDAWLVAEARRGAAGARGRDPESSAARAAPLQPLSAALLPAHVWQQVQACRRVFVVPDGALHRLPFEALIVDGTEQAPVRWLDCGPPVAYTTSGSLLVWSRRRPSAPPGAIDVTAVGDVDFTRHVAPSAESVAALATRGGFAPLPGTRAELDALVALVAPERLRCFSGSDATEVQLAAVARGSRILHLATHGIAEEFAGSSLSALVLAAKTGGAANDDGFLHLQELLTSWNNRCSGCDLVVLSACRTAFGRDRRDEATAALAMGFFHAGARSVIASIWSVDDASTARLMTTFYGRLFHDRQLQRVDRLAALHASKRELARTHAAPYYWAPFLYFGSPD